MPKTVDERLALWRSDGWVNVISGLGMMAKDKAQGGNYCPELRRNPIDDEALWRGDDMAAKVVEKPVFEMMRAGFEVAIKVKDKATKADARGRTDAFPPAAGVPVAPPKPQLPPGVDPISKAIAAIKRNSESKEISEALGEKFKRLKVRERFTEALNYDRAIGGAGLLMGIDDGQKLDKPLRRDPDTNALVGIKSLKWLTPLHRLWMQPYAMQGDPSAEDFGEIMLWRIQVPQVSYNYAGSEPVQTPPELIVHSSRLLMWQGVRTSLQQILSNGGFGDSIFMRLYRPLRDFQQAQQGAAILMQDFAQAIVKIKGLAELLMTDQDDKVKLRMQLIDLSRSIARCVVLDADEDFERKSTSLAGYPEMLDRFALRYCAAADMPETVIMGKSPKSSMSGGGDSEDRSWKDKVAAMQVTNVEPQMHRLIEVEFASADGVTAGVPPESWSVKWNPLHRPTEKEAADARYVQAQTDQIYWNIQVMSEDDIATSAFGGSEYSFERQIDFEARAAIQKAQAEAPPLPVVVTPPKAGEPAPAPAKGDELDGFDPSQPRDKDGKFGEGSGSESKAAPKPFTSLERARVEHLVTKSKAKERAGKGKALSFEEAKAVVIAERGNAEADAAMREKMANVPVVENPDDKTFYPVYAAAYPAHAVDKGGLHHLAGAPCKTCKPEHVMSDDLMMARSHKDLPAETVCKKCLAIAHKRQGDEADDLVTLDAYDPDQPRAANGEWGEGGEAGAEPALHPETHAWGQTKAKETGKTVYANHSKMREWPGGEMRPTLSHTQPKKGNYHAIEPSGKTTYVPKREAAAKPRLNAGMSKPEYRAFMERHSEAVAKREAIVKATPEPERYVPLKKR